MLCGLQNVITLGGKQFAIVPVSEGGASMMPAGYPNWDVGGHPPLRGTPTYPYGHPGYFAGHNAGSCPGYTGGATDTYGGYAGAGGKAQIAAFL